MPHTPILTNLHTNYYGKSPNSCLNPKTPVSTRKPPKHIKITQNTTNLGSRASPNISAYTYRGTIFQRPEEFVPRPLNLDT